MVMRLNMEAYAKMIREDVEWLKKHAPHDLERSHIIGVLWDSIRMKYADECPDCKYRGNYRCKKCGGDQRVVIKEFEEEK